MSKRNSILTIALVFAAGAIALPATTQAQNSNRGQLVQAVAKLNAAQLAFARKLADDASFAKQFDDATASGNYDVAVGLASAVTGIAKSYISISPKGVPSDELAVRAPNAQRTSAVHLASFRRTSTAPMATGFLCFNLGIVAGCVRWD